MANTYNPQAVGVTPPAGGFQEGGWYNGRQYWGGTLSDPGVIHPNSNQQGAGQLVSPEVNLQSDVAQGNKPGDIERYLAKQREAQRQKNVTPTANMSATNQQVSGSGMTGLPGQAVTPQATINLPDMYKSLMESSGIKQKEADLAEKERIFTETKSVINDNPYISEATRVGRVRKLEELHADRTKNLRDEIATAKADAETQLNLQLKQFDINSQQAKQALDQMNFLLESGALNNASGEDVANLTRSTGISSNMIYSAIEANKKKNTKTEIIKSEDDNGVVTVTVIDQDGNVVKQSSLGAIGNKQGTTGTMTSTKNLESQFVNDAGTLSGDQVGVFPQLVAKYAPYLSLQDIYKFYLNTDVGRSYGTPTESAEEVNELYNYYRGQ